MRRRRVIALGLDAADPVLLERWMDEGRLPNLARLRSEGAYGRLRSTVELHGQRIEAFSTEPLWVDFATGCRPTRTGCWDSIVYDAERYSVRNLDAGAPVLDRIPPFYALGETRRVAVMDVPMARLSDSVDGLQLLGWGGHFPHTLSHSQPSGLYDEIVSRHGANPILGNDAGIWWDKPYLRWLDQALRESVERRVAVCEDLLSREPWDLFLAVFSETHSAGHEAYCFSQDDHPLHQALVAGTTAEDMVRRTYEDTDRAIGTIVAQAPADACIVCFSLHGMGPNYSDLLSAAILPEMLYRLDFPGSVALGGGNDADPPGAMLTSARRGSWMGEVWTRHMHAGPLARFVRSWLPGRLLRQPFNGLASPFSDAGQTEPMLWHPAAWYRPLWPRMRAFALPGFTKGRIRINLQGRDPAGRVAPQDYHRVCDEIEAVLHRLRDGRSGEPVVREVYRTRGRDPLADDGLLPDFDLDVLWHERITDVVDSPDVGRIGPLPHFRAGGHWNRGFVLAAGPEIAAGTRLPEAEVVDLAPTILGFMGCPVPTHFEGRSVLAPDGGAQRIAASA